jgi:hypothetical protein
MAFFCYDKQAMEIDLKKYKENQLQLVFRYQSKEGKSFKIITFPHTWNAIDVGQGLALLSDD